jgi:hypothetical protein
MLFTRWQLLEGVRTIALTRASADENEDAEDDLNSVDANEDAEYEACLEELYAPSRF